MKINKLKIVLATKKSIEPNFLNHLKMSIEIELSDEMLALDFVEIKALIFEQIMKDLIGKSSTMDFSR